MKQNEQKAENTIFKFTKFLVKCYTKTKMLAFEKCQLRM